MDNPPATESLKKTAPHIRQVLNAGYSARGKTLWWCPHPRWNLGWLPSVQIVPMQSQGLWVHTCAGPIRSGNHHFVAVLHHLCLLPCYRWAPLVWPSSPRAGITVKEQADPLLIYAAPCLAPWCLPPTCVPDRLPSATRMESNDASAVSLNLINYGLNKPLRFLLSVTQPLVFYYSNRKGMDRVPCNCNPWGQNLGIHVLRCFRRWLWGHLSPLMLGTTELASGWIFSSGPLVLISGILLSFSEFQKAGHMNDWEMASYMLVKLDLKWKLTILYHFLEHGILALAGTFDTREIYHAWQIRRL